MSSILRTVSLSSSVAISLGSKNPVPANLLLKNCLQQIEFQQTRAAKSPAQSQRGFKKKHLIYQLLKNPGDRVDERMTIGTQKRLNYHPGLNVAINPRDKSLYSLCAGTVYYSIEKFVPNAESKQVQLHYQIDSILSNPSPFYRKYIHVVPDKLTNQFKLIDLV